MADHVDDLKRVLESLGGTRAHLVGHSYGAYLALMVAIRYPALINKLVLAEPPVIPLFTGFPPKPKRLLRALFSRPKTALPIIRFLATGLAPAASAARRGEAEAALAHMGKAILGAEAFNALSRTRLEQARDNYIKAELLSDGVMLALDAKDVSNIRAQTLLITGERSPVLWHRLTDRLEELIPDTTRVDIPNASHIVHEDNAAAFNHTVLSFLGA